MTGIDTNVLVRFLTQDDPEQGRLARDFLAGLSEADAGFVCREVVIELVWVLERAYGLTRDEIAGAVDALLETREIVIEDAESVVLAAQRYRQGGAGFADQMVALAGVSAGCGHTVTFDLKAARIPGMRLLE